MLFYGGALLNRVKWPRKSKIAVILQEYAKYIKNIAKNIAGRVTVVFDGYLEKSTKDHIHKKRYPVSSMQMIVTTESEIQCDKDIFLSNPENKQIFIINLLAQHLADMEIHVQLCKRDADVMIVQSAVQKAMEKNVMIIGDDTDLLVLAVHFIEQLKPPNKIHFHRQASNTYVAVECVHNTVPMPVRTHILPIHTLSGCDTVSQLFGIGKDRLYKLMCKNPSLISKLESFSHQPYNEESVKESGLNIIGRLYNMKDTSYED